MELIIVRKNKTIMGNTKENIETIIFGTLIEGHSGFKTGAKVRGILNYERNFCFLIANDIEDENFGHILIAGQSIPKVEINKELTLETVTTTARFFAYFELLVKRINIPVTFELFENEF